MKRLLFILACSVTALWGHVGSPDVYYDGNAGPYPLAVVVRPPSVVPGVAELEIRTTAKDLERLRVTTLKLTGAGAKYAPVPDDLKRSAQDPQFWTGSIWLMSSGAAQVRLEAFGARGPGTLSVPVPALAQRTATMQTGLGAILGVLTVVLVLGIVGIVGAAFRDSTIVPGAVAPAPRIQRARWVMALTAAITIGILWLGNAWWTAEAKGYQRSIFQPLEAKPTVDAANSRLTLTLHDPGWLVPRKVDDFLPDHEHLMHLYLVSLPSMDRVWHLHPEMTGPGVFTQDLPAMPPGQYRLYGDVVHQNGLAETVVTELALPAPIAGHPLQGDDAGGVGLALGKQTDVKTILADGTQVIWERPAGTLTARQPELFRFRVLDAAGQPATDVVPYMGMAGHAAFVKSDGSTFAHIHPSGSVPMAALQLAGGPGDPHAGHHNMRLAPELSFPYGFPQPGDYRMIVQFRRGDTVETAFFDTPVK